MAELPPLGHELVEWLNSVSDKISSREELQHESRAKVTIDARRSDALEAAKVVRRAGFRSFSLLAGKFYCVSLFVCFFFRQSRVITTSQPAPDRNTRSSKQLFVFIQFQTVVCVHPVPNSCVCYSSSKQLFVLLQFRTVVCVTPVPNSCLCSSSSEQLFVFIQFRTVVCVHPVPNSCVCYSSSEQ
uniref:(California timema) hypothetical protein n=1 Tax=Timema californicum TaxID=61474 RepID=A0A7R9JCE7_TIMCA|nr:unnamed protein product [Timema californicum]